MASFSYLYAISTKLFMKTNNFNSMNENYYKNIMFWGTSMLGAKINMHKSSVLLSKSTISIL